jgi:hypothetical protein
MDAWGDGEMGYWGPESAVCIYNILKKKMPGGETACFSATFYLDNIEFFVRVGAGSPRPHFAWRKC